MEVTVNIQLTGEDIQLLNNIISNSVPTVNFATVSKLVAKINSQLQEQTSKQDVVQKEPYPKGYDAAEIVN